MIGGWGWLKSGSLLFWALWLTVVCLTNLLDCLKALGILPASWTLSSGNWELVAKATAVHTLPVGVAAFLMACAVLWEGIAAGALWWAWFRFDAAAADSLAGVRAAYAVSLALWAAFMLADEIFLQYAIEPTHMRIFVAQLVTLLAVHLLPEG